MNLDHHFASLRILIAYEATFCILQVLHIFNSYILENALSELQEQRNRL